MIYYKTDHYLNLDCIVLCNVLTVPFEYIHRKGEQYVYNGIEVAQTRAIAA
jgi:hypothetical protein